MDIYYHLKGLVISCYWKLSGKELHQENQIQGSLSENKKENTEMVE